MKLVIQNILNDKARARLGFQIDLADVLADYTNGQQDQTADCPNEQITLAHPRTVAPIAHRTIK